MAPSGRDWANNPGNVAQAIVNNNERELLRRIWLEADATPTAFVSIDTEYTPQGVCELGIATRQKHNPTMARHIIVNGTRELRQRNPKTFKFGPSEEVQYEGELLPVLLDTLANLQSENAVVVLTGHDVQVELRNLKKCCGWEVPNQVIVLDTLRIWRSWINVPVRGGLEQALEFFDLLDKQAGLHNAGNDAKYTMELLVHKAIQAVASPVPMDRNDHEVPEAKLAKAFGTNNRYLQEPVTPGLGTGSGKKRKRDAEQAMDLSRLARSSGPLSEHERSTQSNHTRKKPRWVKAMRAAMHGAGREIRGAGRGTGAREARSGNDEIIDLTGDTSSRQVPSGLIDGAIDLTGDTPPPESAEQFQGYRGQMDGQDDLEHTEGQPKMEFLPDPDVATPASASDGGAVMACDISIAGTGESGPMNKQWCEQMKGMLRKTGNRQPPESAEPSQTYSDFMGRQSGLEPMEDKQEMNLSPSHYVGTPFEASNSGTAAAPGIPASDAGESGARNKRWGQEMMGMVMGILSGHDEADEQERHGET